MDQTVFCFASEHCKFVAVQHRGHAKILPWSEAFNGKHNVLLYTSQGKARQALSTRNIYTLYVPDADWRDRDNWVLCSKDELHVTPLKLSLDKP